MMFLLGVLTGLAAGALLWQSEAKAAQHLRERWHLDWQEIVKLKQRIVVLARSE
jgi:hypothetical protein